jgi:hypothetical protein
MPFLRVGMAALVCAWVLSRVLDYAGGEDGATTHDASGFWLYTDSTGRHSTWVITQWKDDTICGAGTEEETMGGIVSGDSICISLCYGASNADAILRGIVSESTMSGNFVSATAGGETWTAVRPTGDEP